MNASLADGIIDHLKFAVRRDLVKGGAGTRTTREVAERAGVEMSQARRTLRKLAADGVVDQFSGGEWRIAKRGF